jgi:hypothetical protein
MAASVFRAKQSGVGAPSPGEIGYDLIGIGQQPFLVLGDRVDLGRRLVAANNQEDGGD